MQPCGNIRDVWWSWQQKYVKFCANVQHMVTRKIWKSTPKGVNFSKQLHEQPSVGYFLKSLHKWTERKKQLQTTCKKTTCSLNFKTACRVMSLSSFSLRIVQNDCKIRNYFIYRTYNHLTNINSVKHTPCVYQRFKIWADIKKEIEKLSEVWEKGLFLSDRFF